MPVPTNDQLTFQVETLSSGTWSVGPIGEQPSVRPDQSIECLLLVKWIDPHEPTKLDTPEYRLQVLSNVSRFATADGSQRFEKAVRDYVMQECGTIQVSFDPDKRRLVEIPPNESQ